MTEEKEPTIAEVTEREAPVKLRPTGTYYVLREVEIKDPRRRILMLEGQEVPDHRNCWRVVAKGPKCEEDIPIGSVVVLTTAQSGRNVPVTGTAYKVANEVEIVAVVDMRRAVVWDDEVEENIGAVQAEIDKKARRSRGIDTAKA